MLIHEKQAGQTKSPLPSLVISSVHYSSIGGLFSASFDFLHNVELKEEKKR